MFLHMHILTGSSNMSLAVPFYKQFLKKKHIP